MKIIITGPKCSGKSTVGRKLAEELGLPFLETDDLIEDIYLKKTNKNLSCRGICLEVGDDKFREIEKTAINEASNRDWCVISTGGSTMLNRESRRLLRVDSILVLLDASICELLTRLENQKIPAFLNNKSAKDLFAARSQTVIEVIKPIADIEIDTSGLDLNGILNRLIGEIEQEVMIRCSHPNTYGQLIRLTTFGESHGKAIGAVLDGVKPGIPISKHDIQQELNRRRPGQSKVSTPRNEKDKLRILSGIFEGKTTGTPIGMIIENKDQDSTKYDNIKELFRPGSADFTFWKKYGIRDHKGGGRSSGRETAGRVMGGAIAKKILSERGVDIIAHTVDIAGIKAEDCVYSQIEQNPVRCADAQKAKEMEQKILEAKGHDDSVGGIVQIEVNGVPAGLGNPVFCKLEARLGMAILSLGAVKGIEFGDGFEVASKCGSENNDQMRNGKFITNHAGGILGGISNGEKIIIRAAVKPTPSIYTKQKTSDKDGNNVDLEVEGRHDPCIIPRIVPVMESMVALTILDAWEIQLRTNPNWVN